MLNYLNNNHNKENVDIYGDSHDEEYYKKLKDSTMFYGKLPENIDNLLITCDNSNENSYHGRKLMAHLREKFVSNESGKNIYYKEYLGGYYNNLSKMITQNAFFIRNLYSNHD